MRRRIAAVVLLALIGVLGLPAESGRRARAASASPHKQSNPGQLKVVTINAKQEVVLDKQSFEMLFELARALRRRPPAFDGGARRAVAAPDVVLVQEMRFSNLEIFKRLLKQRYPYMYEIAGAENATTRILVNLDTVTPTGEGGTWDDVCLGGRDQGGRTYQWLGLTENDTGAPFAVAAVHFSQRYSSTGQHDCLRRNVQLMRAQLDLFPGATIAGGDFNKRAMTEMAECDPAERSDPLGWYEEMVAPDVAGVAYADAARVVRRRRDASLATEWTFERARRVPTCRGDVTFKRSRIDYLFARGAVVADAGADDPGWSGGAPGTRHPTNYRYSDHRFVWARIVLARIDRGRRPAPVAQAGGIVDVSWDPVADATGYMVLRAHGRRPYKSLATVGAEVTSYRDHNTRHGSSYRYSIAPLAASGQGWESVPSWARADARGPVVAATSPARGARGVDLRSRVVIRFDERVKGSSVDERSVRLRRAGRAVAGTVTRIAPRVVRFTPDRRLRNATVYRVVIRGVTDTIGNRAPDDAWSFKTKPRRRR